MFRAWSSLLALSAATVLALPLTSCGDDATGPDREPQFDAVVEGGDLPRLDGIALFRVEARSGGADHGFALYLIADDVSGELALRTLTTALPTTGEHEVVPPADREDPTEFRGTLRYVAGGVLQEFEVRSGTLRVTAVREEQIEGTLEIRARRALDDQQVYVTATFTARPYEEIAVESSHALAVSGALEQSGRPRAPIRWRAARAPASPAIARPAARPPRP